ncbi:MAG: right-handed parallel beta-helix repeat-containing protein, partial [Phycisphaerales bacterium]|nr:right-handed parallel beta-helix repeat-containing protein [Phycisphaerales bacterium]
MTRPHSRRASRFAAVVILIGIAGSLDGVSVTATGLGNIAVLNGSVRNWGGAGIQLGSPVTTSCRIAGIRSVGNGLGVRCGDYSAVADCVLNDNTGIGLLVGNSSTVTNCITNSNTGSGLGTGFCAAVTNCTANDNGGFGVSTGTGSTISNTIARNNATGGLAITQNSTVIGCTIVANNTVGIRSTSDGTILNCTISSTLGGGGSGVTSSFGGLRIENSSINNNSCHGVIVDAAAPSAKLSITGCNICGNLAGGVSSVITTQVLDSVVSENSGVGIRVSGSSLIRGCTINSNSLSGVELTANGNVVQNNMISSNAALIATAAGIRVQGADNTVDGNRLSANAQGSIKINAGGNLVLRNSLSGSGAA